MTIIHMDGMCIKCNLKQCVLDEKLMKDKAWFKLGNGKKRIYIQTSYGDGNCDGTRLEIPYTKE